MISGHTLEDETVPDSDTQTHAHTQSSFLGEGSLFSLRPEAAWAPLGDNVMRHSQSSSSQHKLRSESRQIFVQGRLRLLSTVTRDCKHHEAASSLTSKGHRQVSSLHIPPNNSSNHHQLQPFLVTSLCNPSPTRDWSNTGG